MRKRTVLLTIDQELVALIDLIAVTEWTSRSAILRTAANEWIDRYNKKTKTLTKAKDILNNKITINDVNRSDAHTRKKPKPNSSWQGSISVKWGSGWSKEGSQSEMRDGVTSMMNDWVHDSSWDLSKRDEANEVKSDINEQDVWNLEYDMDKTEWVTTAWWLQMNWETETDEFVSDFPLW